MTLILPSFDVESEKTFTPPARVAQVREPRWHNWFVGLSLVALTLIGFWVIWGKSLVAWTDTLL
jgi:hypothetical protein